ncbi:hypothetical protein L1887_16741 [Cichorium endivia]|nr:hypothetical protein L1887_16741 [Cichorium endivia]
MMLPPLPSTLKPHEYIGMVRREVLDAYLRDRAAAAGATIINGLFFKMEKPTDKYAPAARRRIRLDRDLEPGKLTVPGISLMGCNTISGIVDGFSRQQKQKR